MKKVLLALTLLVSLTTFSQEENSKPSYYLAAGLSVTNSEDFSSSSYFSVEGGVMYDNVSFGAVVGRNNLSGLFEDISLNNYWGELKTAVSHPLGFVNIYGVLGVGAYFENGNMFIEYGAGLSKEFKTFGVFLQISNWDGVDYITPGISINL